MKYKKSLFEALICFFREKSTSNTINIGLEKSTFCQSENWQPSSHCFYGSDTCVFFLGHEKATSTSVDDCELFVGDTAEEFDGFPCDFLEFWLLCTIANYFEINAELGHHPYGSIDLFEWCERARDNIIITSRDCEGSNRETSRINRRPEHDRLTVVVFIYTVADFGTIGHVDIWTLCSISIPFS